MSEERRVVMCPVCGLAAAAEHYSGFGNDYVCGVNRAAYAELVDSDLDDADEGEV